jgi:GAF domain-containing protein
MTQIPSSQIPTSQTRHSIRFLTDPAKQSVLIASALIGIVIYFLRISQTIPVGNWFLTTVYSVTFLGIILLAFIPRIPLGTRYPIYLILLLILGSIDLFYGGLVGDGIYFLFLFTILTALFYRNRVGLLAATIPFVELIVVAFAMTSKLITPDPIFLASQSSTVIAWILIAVILLFGVITSQSGIYQFIPGLTASFFSQQDRTEQLIAQNEVLNKSIDDAALNLQRKTSELAIASQIARNIALQQDPLNLMDTTLGTIRDQFGFYHAGLFLIDDTREYAILKAATGEAGREMLAQDHKLKVGAQGIVGFVADLGVARIAADVGQDSVHFLNPLLPNTHSEMALPLRLGDRIIGVLDVQSEQQAAFTQQDVNIIQTIADQLAISIDHSRIVAELQSNLEEYKSRTQSTTQRDWANYLLGIRSPKSLRYTSKGIQKASLESALAKDAFLTGKTQIKTRKAKSGKIAIIAVPLQLRGANIGVIELKIADPTEVPDFQSLIESIASRLVLSLENARLIEEMQIRMEQDKMVSDITSKVRSSTVINDILRETAVELGKSLGLSDVRVQLRTKTNLEQAVDLQKEQA